MKKLILSFISLVIVFAMFGCTSPTDAKTQTLPETEAKTEPSTEIYLSDDEISEQQGEFINIGFSSTDDEDVIEKIIPVEELKAWENPYGKYSSYVLYDTLTDDEKLVYHALEYAMVNSYTRTFIDYRINVSATGAELIADLLSQDTPLLEQNLQRIAYPQVAFYDYQYSESRTVKVLHRSTTISVTNFTQEHWEKKMLALSEAEKVIEQMDMTKPEVELAEDIYRYIAENVTYIPYENEMGYYRGYNKPFLYDAMVKKRSHCDGFTNALALLYSMAGVEQVEKSDTKVIGHTWNFVKIEGKWYNVDGTFNKYLPDPSSSMGGGYGFAFADEMQFAPTDFSERYPECTQSYYLNPDGYTESCDSDDYLDILLEGFDNHNGEWALVITDTYDAVNAKYACNSIAQIYYTQINYITYETFDNKYASLYFDADIM